MRTITYSTYGKPEQDLTGIWINFLIILVLILINAFFALSELAIVSARPERLQAMAMTGQKGAAKALEMTREPASLLSTVQVGITLVGILAGAFGGATISGELAAVMTSWPLVGPYADAISLVLVVGLITYLSVVIGELVPKQLALQNPEAVAVRVARPMDLLSRLARPIVIVLTFSTNAVLALFGIDSSARANDVTEEEIRVLVQQGAEAGIFEEAESEMVESIFRFGDRQLRSLMTPRNEIVWLDITNSPSENSAVTLESRHSQFPVADGELDKVLGTVRAKNMLARNWDEAGSDLDDIMEQPFFLPETMLAINALERFKEQGAHMALIVDEFGGIEGLVTLIDILEAIVGDIPTEDEIADPPVTIREDGSLLIDGKLTIDDLRETLGTGEFPDDDDYQTLGGFIIYTLGRLPRAGDAFIWSTWRFEVVDMDGNRIDKVLVEPTPSS